MANSMNHGQNIYGGPPGAMSMIKAGSKSLYGCDQGPQYGQEQCHGHFGAKTMVWPLVLTLRRKTRAR